MDNHLKAGTFSKGFGYEEEQGDPNSLDPNETISENANVNRASGGVIGDRVPGSSLEPCGGQKPKILIMGLRRSGKSSIQKVVFHKMSPNETLFLESTNKIVKDDISNSSFVSFSIWDFPEQIDFFDPTFDKENIFGGCGALVFVIDAQDDYTEALSKLHMTVTRAYKVNPNIQFEVFIHKVDGLSDDHKIETQRDIQQKANDELLGKHVAPDFERKVWIWITTRLTFDCFSTDEGLKNIHLSFYLTSIYDHSIFEAFSKVVQKLIPQLGTLENLLNIFISVSLLKIYNFPKIPLITHEKHCLDVLYLPDLSQTILNASQTHQTAHSWADPYN